MDRANAWYRARSNRSTSGMRPAMPVAAWRSRCREAPASRRIRALPRAVLRHRLARLPPSLSGCALSSSTPMRWLRRLRGSRRLHGACRPPGCPSGAPGARAEPVAGPAGAAASISAVGGGCRHDTPAGARPRSASRQRRRLGGPAFRPEDRGGGPGGVSDGAGEVFRARRLSAADFARRTAGNAACFMGPRSVRSRTRRPTSSVTASRAPAAIASS